MRLRMSPHGLVAPRRKRLPVTIGLALALPLIESRTDAGTDLALLLRPTHRLPQLYQIAERFNPPVRSRLLAPQIEKMHPAIRIQPNHKVDSVVAAIGGNRVV